MTPTHFVRSKQFKIAGMALTLALTVIGLIRCGPSDQAVVSDEAANERVKEAEAAEEAEAAALKVAHGEDAEKPHARKPASDQMQVKMRPAHPAAHSAIDKKVVYAPAAGHAVHAKTKSTSSSSSPSAKIAGSVYVVQIGAFRVKENAEKLTAELKSKGFAAHMQSVEHAKNGEMHLVRLEPTEDKSKAEESLAELKEKQSLTAQILSVPAGI